MRILKFVFITLIILLGVFSGYAVLSGKTYLFKAAYHNFSAIDDYTIFENNKVAKAKVVKPWPLADQYNQQAYPDSLNRLLEALRTVGVLMIKNDSILFEKYWDGYSDSSLSGSFSVAKSITSILIGVSIKEGKIKSVDQPVGDFLPAFAIGDKAAVKIKDLLTMSSGTDWNESYWNPLSVTAEAYYGSDLVKTATEVKMDTQPGSFHKYKSGDTQLLGLILEKVTGKKLSEYADDTNGNTTAFCCFNTNARDFARIGKFMLDSGKINGVPVIDSAYWKQSITACNIKDEKGLDCIYYGYQWWIDPQHPEIFYARGILGQYIIVIPSKKIVIVRLAHKASKERVLTVPKEVRALINWGLNS
jgi:CubicO group peptidase (beta-lactamase class C family)